jgi:hypothetical protein
MSAEAFALARTQLFALSVRRTDLAAHCGAEHLNNNSTTHAACKIVRGLL